MDRNEWQGMGVNSWTPIFLCLALAGCSSAPSARVSSGGFHSEVIGRSVEGREITAEITGGRGPAYLIFGVIHGNEPAGEPLLRTFLGHLKADPELYAGHRLVVIPVLNPDGLLKRSRYNSRGVDLNRNFPAKNFKKSKRNGPYPSSEPETKALMKMIRQFRPARILAVHAPLFCVNYDGPADRLAGSMAQASGYPLKPSIGYPTPEKAWSDLGRALEIFVSD